MIPIHEIREALEAALLDYEPCDGGLPVKETTERLRRAVAEVEALRLENDKYRAMLRGIHFTMDRWADTLGEWSDRIVVEGLGEEVTRAE